MLETLYDHHSKLQGGSFFNDFLHGFAVPLKQFGSVLNLAVPDLGTAVTTGVNAVDQLVPGKRYDIIRDAVKGKTVVDGNVVARARWWLLLFNVC